MVSISPIQTAAQARDIPQVTAAEAYSLLKVQLERFLDLLETLEPADWDRPTACTEWTVKDIVAHQAGGYASGTGYREMFRQYSAMLKPGSLPEDAINARQVGERAGRTPDELIAELRRAGPAAIQNWAYGFRLIRPVVFPHPIAGLNPLRYLFWVTHSRDTWMHRLDICRAAGRPFEQSAGQDGRIAALVVADVERKLRSRLAGKSLIIELSGPSGGAWQLGLGEPAAAVQADALDFNIFVSGRFGYPDFLSRASISGDAHLVETLFENLLILY